MDASQELIKEKIEDHKFITKLALIFLGLIIIALLLPVVLGLLDSIGQVAIGEDVVDNIFGQSTYLKYFFWTSIALVVAQLLIVITFCIKVDKLNKQLY